MYNLILSFFILLVSALPSYSAENKLSFETQALLNALGSGPINFVDAFKPV